MGALDGMSVWLAHTVTPAINDRCEASWSINTFVRAGRRSATVMWHVELGRDGGIAGRDVLPWVVKRDGRSYEGMCSISSAADRVAGLLVDGEYRQYTSTWGIESAPGRGVAQALCLSMTALVCGLGAPRASAARVALALEEVERREARVKAEEERQRAMAQESWCYLIAAPNGMVKIGHSINPRQRLDNMQTGCPVPLALLGALPGGVGMEADLHERFAELRCHGEWFVDAPEIREAFGVAGAS